jgi:hypothetical protein
MADPTDTRPEMHASYVFNGIGWTADSGETVWRRKLLVEKMRRSLSGPTSHRPD